MDFRAGAVAPVSDVDRVNAFYTRKVDPDPDRDASPECAEPSTRCGAWKDRRSSGYAARPQDTSLEAPWRQWGFDTAPLPSAYRQAGAPSRGCICTQSLGPPHRARIGNAPRNRWASPISPRRG